MSNLRKATEQALAILQDIHPGNMTPMAEDSWVRASQKLYAALAEDKQPEPVGEVEAYDDYGHPWKRISGYGWELAKLPIGAKVYACPPQTQEIPKGVLDAIRNAGLTLVQTAKGYKIMKLGEVRAN